jgi:hypothetical protein
MARGMRPRQFPETFDRGEARLLERLFLAGELLEHLADLPIGRVNDSHRPSPN